MAKLNLKKMKKLKKDNKRFGKTDRRLFSNAR